MGALRWLGRRLGTRVKRLVLGLLFIAAMPLLLACDATYVLSVSAGRYALSRDPAVVGEELHTSGARWKRWLRTYALGGIRAAGHLD